MIKLFEFTIYSRNFIHEYNVKNNITLKCIGNNTFKLCQMKTDIFMQTFNVFSSLDVDYE